MKNAKRLFIFPLLAGAVLLIPAVASAAQDGSGSHAGAFPAIFFFLVVMLLAARIGALAERFRQPAVLGELLMGVALGALALAPWFHGLEVFKTDPFIKDIAEIGVILLLFRAGLESNLGEMKKVGVRAGIVAVIGVILPFIGGWLVSRLLLPEYGAHTHLFIGATLTATSVGITARVFKDLGFLKSIEAKIVLGAAVIDDVLGLLILAVVSGVVSGGSLGVGGIALLSLKAFLFLVGSVVLGQLLAPHLGGWLSRIHTGVGMKMATALLFCGAGAYGAYELAGLAPIVGAFAAGLVLDPVHFGAFAAPHMAGRLRAWANRSDKQDVRQEMEEAAKEEEHSHVENLIDGVSSFFVPVFFVYTGMQVNLMAFANPSTVAIGLAITAVAFLGKIACGWFAGKGADAKIVGFGMIPRGEVGLIFANIGRELGVVDDRAFAIVLIVVVLSTLLTPPILATLIRRKSLAAS